MFAFKGFITGHLHSSLNSATLKKIISIRLKPADSNLSAVPFYYLRSQSSFGSTSFGSLLKHSEITRLSSVTKVFLWKHYYCIFALTFYGRQPLKHGAALSQIHTHPEQAQMPRRLEHAKTFSSHLWLAEFNIFFVPQTKLTVASWVAAESSLTSSVLNVLPEFA